MSKVLKFIVHFVVICALICVAGMIVPPFFGVRTVIMDDADIETNLPMGSVTYAIPVKTEEIRIGDPILVDEDSKAYRYTLTALNTENGTGTVIDTTVSQSENITVAVKNYMPKVVITIGLIGYLMVATKSIEGLIVLALAVLFLIILYVIAELWKKEPQEAYEEEDPAAGYVKSKKELKQEEKQRARLLKEEEREIRQEQKGRKKKKKEEKKLIRTGGFVDEIYEDDIAPEEPETPVTVQTATSEAHELLKKEIAAATAQEEAPARAPQKPVRRKAPAKKSPKPVRPVQAEEEEPAPQEFREMAMPVLTAAQLAERAKRAGDAPDIVRDEITNVTLLDYSDIIGEDPEAEE